jgi:predicted ArsR family transcriptional regulator
VNLPALPTDLGLALERLAPLLEPARRRVFAFVAQADHPVTRDEAAAATGFSLPLATFHLEKLLEAGLVEAPPPDAHAEPAPRRRGRPAKLYRPVRQDLLVNLPARDYRLAAELFADALAQGGRSQSLDAAARLRGRSMGSSVRERAGRSRKPAALMAALVEVLADAGYEPRTSGDGSVTLRNCPFEALTERHGDLTCPANLALLGGMIEGAGISAARAVLDPGEGRCCVVVRAASEQADERARSGLAS